MTSTHPQPKIVPPWAIMARAPKWRAIRRCGRLRLDRRPAPRLRLGPTLVARVELSKRQFALGAPAWLCTTL